jgi:hypothetical protein
MDDLISTEKSTERILTPSIWPAVKEIGRSVGGGLSRVFRTVVLHRPPKRVLHVDRPEVSVSQPSVPPSAAIKQIGLSVGQKLVVIGKKVLALLRRQKTVSAVATAPRVQYARPSFSHTMISTLQE